MTDDELLAAARWVAKIRGYPPELDAAVEKGTRYVRVVLRDPAYIRGGGLTVIIDPAARVVVEVIPGM